MLLQYDVTFINVNINNVHTKKQQPSEDNFKTGTLPTQQMTNYQRWSPRGRGLGLEDPRGQLMVSLALALKLQSLASDSKSLALALNRKS